jgi:hypothetical protein
MKKSKTPVEYVDIIILFEGKTKQRFKCKRYGIFLSEYSPEKRVQNGFICFRNWVLEHQTYQILSRDCGLIQLG